MNIIPIKTEKVIAAGEVLGIFLDRYIQNPPDSSILAVTSKIVAILEGNTVDKNLIQKDQLVAREADLLLPRSASRYGIMLTVKNGILIPTAGIDESNIEDKFVLWPKDPNKSAYKIWLHFKTKYNLNEFGVIITDSKTTPLRRGTTGIALAHCGFQSLNSYIGKLDLFNQPLRVTTSNVMDGLAAAAVFVMGEGNEQTPLALITDTDNVNFTNDRPSDDELSYLRISIEEDLYAPILQSTPWVSKEKNESTD